MLVLMHYKSMNLQDVAEIIGGHYYGARGIKAITLAALADICSMRNVNGLRDRIGLMGVDFSTTSRLYRETVCKDYKVKSVKDLYNPFASMYYGASYLVWFSEYDGSHAGDNNLNEGTVIGSFNGELCGSLAI